MGKLIFWILLVAIGVGIGIKYEDQIMDALNMRDMEEVQDSLEDASDSVQSGIDTISKKVDELAEQN
ncbi:MAG: YtxH domain-containing protein [Vibrio sp.]